VFALLVLVFGFMAVESHDEEHHESHDEPGGSNDPHHNEAASVH
jgi:hypothetical protein